MTDRPLFIDPISVGGGDDVDDAPVPRWFTLVAVLIIGIVAYYAASFWSGPREDSQHRFQTDTEVIEHSGTP